MDPYAVIKNNGNNKNNKLWLGIFIIHEIKEKKGATE